MIHASDWTTAYPSQHLGCGAGWRLGDPAVEGCVAASDARRDGQAVAW